MKTLASVALATLVTADAERVWDALTATKTPLSYFHGMTITSDWQPGSTITMRQEDELGQGGTRKFWDVAISGEVLAADPPHRLSYTLGECQSDPTVYVTWELRSGDGLTIVRLNIDEPDAYPDSEDELDIVWLPILSALAEKLSNPPATGQAA
jgi:uncharacterized protein YndB with AHSA1/START domain